MKKPFTGGESIMKKILASIMAVFLVVAMSGCKDDTKKQSTNLEETKAVSEGDYAALLPYEASTARHSHAILSTNQTETFTVGKGHYGSNAKTFDPRYICIYVKDSF